MPELEHGDINKVLDLYLNDDIKGLGDAVFNSLQKPAISVVNEIETVINSLKEDGFDCVLMSGSGSCVYASSSFADTITIKQGDAVVGVFGKCFGNIRYGS